ncbi:MAG TPA: class I SAM-dependent methyltransferase [Thermoleophilia bacterium]|nr:class I SAM-dependent methyltransferase [Thermoleophilia bacterium]
MTDDVWREFFDSYAPQYMNEVFTADSLREAAFLVDVLGLEPGASVLDIGCGTGRHAVELARAGLVVTGLDISSGMLREARRAADAAGVDLELVQGDATTFDLGRAFDAAVCLCEGSFGLLGSDDPFDHDAAVLARAFAALRPGAPLVLTVLNGLRMIRDATPEQVERGEFDPATLTQAYAMEWQAEDGPRSLPVRERGYVPSELVLLCRSAGFVVEHVWGGTAGDWGRRPVELDEMEVMVVLRKPAT